jgi:hypothetical protein
MRLNGYRSINMDRVQRYVSSRDAGVMDTLQTWDRDLTRGVENVGRDILNYTGIGDLFGMMDGTTKSKVNEITDAMQADPSTESSVISAYESSNGDSSTFGASLKELFSNDNINWDQVGEALWDMISPGTEVEENWSNPQASSAKR